MQYIDSWTDIRRPGNMEDRAKWALLDTVDYTSCDQFDQTFLSTERRCFHKKREHLTDCQRPVPLNGTGLRTETQAPLWPASATSLLWRKT